MGSAQRGAYALIRQESPSEMLQGEMEEIRELLDGRHKIGTTR
jgi:hypothetical protein